MNPIYNKNLQNLTPSISDKTIKLLRWHEREYLTEGVAASLPSQRRQPSVRPVFFVFRRQTLIRHFSNRKMKYLM